VAWRPSRTGLHHRPEGRRTGPHLGSRGCSRSRSRLYSPSASTIRSDILAVSSGPSTVLLVVM